MLSKEKLDTAYQAWQQGARQLRQVFVMPTAESIPHNWNYGPVPYAFHLLPPAPKDLPFLFRQGYSESFINHLQRWAPDFQCLQAAGNVPQGCPLIRYFSSQALALLPVPSIRQWTRDLGLKSGGLQLLLLPPRPVQQIWLSGQSLQLSNEPPVPEAIQLFGDTKAIQASPPLLPPATTFLSGTIPEIAEILHI